MFDSENWPKRNSLGLAYSWKCSECDKRITSWTASGLNILKNIHLHDHYIENQIRGRLFQETLAMLPLRNYDRLKITFEDFCFLITRGIKIDDDMEYVSAKTH